MKLALVALVLLSFSVPSFADRDTIPLLSPSKSGSASPAPAKAKPAPDPGAAGDDDEDGAAMPKPYIASVDAYGSQRINEVILKEVLGSDLDKWLQMGVAGDPKSVEVEKKITEKIKAKYGFVSADWSIIEYFEPGDLAIHITLDVVEKEDVAKRMPFMTAPTAELKDPEGLIKAWEDYEELALDLVESGQLEPEADECPAFHCPFGHKHPQLKKFEKIFVEGAKKHEKELIEIQTKDKRPEFRASATYLLAYMKDGKKVVAQMVNRIKDPDAMVRNNALRVLGDIAEFNPELIIPIRPILDAFEFPRVSDRSKAVYVAYLMALGSQQAREEILKSSVPTLVQMLGSSQPDHKEIAHGILRKISGKEYANTDVQSWKNWYTKLPGNSGKALSRK